jgi:hypothetical protein
MDPCKELVERIGIPPSVHVRLAGAQAACRENAGVERRIVDVNIPGSASVDTDVATREQFSDSLLRYAAGQR